MNNADTPNARLLPRAQAGDTSALGQLLDEYRGYLSILARLQLGRQLQSKVDASDIVQEAFLGAYRDFPQFRGANSAEFAGWLRKILVHVIANVVRHYHGTQRRDIGLERQLEADLAQSSVALERAFWDRGPTPSQTVVQKETRLLVADALEQLDCEDRELLILKHIEGMSFAVIAKQTNHSVDSVKRRWPRALARFRELIKSIE